LEKANIPFDNTIVYRGEYRASSGELLAAQLLREHPEVTAIIAGNNAIAIGVMAAIKKSGKKIPDDIALVAFDDLPTVIKMDSYLTVIAQPAYDLGQAAANLLITRINAPTRPIEQIILPTRLIIRSSSQRSYQEVTIPGSREIETSITIQPIINEQRSKNG
jgi:LacI family transcriptional regulator